MKYEEVTAALVSYYIKRIEVSPPNNQHQRHLQREMDLSWGRSGNRRSRLNSRGHYCVGKDEYAFVTRRGIGKMNARS